MNASSVPAQDKCDKSCSCNDGEVLCEKKSCPESHIEPGMVCTEFFLEGECCPSHECVKEDDTDLESGSQLMTTTMVPEEASTEESVTAGTLEEAFEETESVTAGTQEGAFEETESVTAGTIEEAFEETESVTAGIIEEAFEETESVTAGIIEEAFEETESITAGTIEEAFEETESVTAGIIEEAFEETEPVTAGSLEEAFEETESVTAGTIEEAFEEEEPVTAGTLEEAFEETEPVTAPTLPEAFEETESVTSGTLELAFGEDDQESENITTEQPMKEVSEEPVTAGTIAEGFEETESVTAGTQEGAFVETESVAAGSQEEAFEETAPVTAGTIEEAFEEEEPVTAGTLEEAFEETESVTAPTLPEAFEETESVTAPILEEAFEETESATAATLEEAFEETEPVTAATHEEAFGESESVTAPIIEEAFEETEPVTAGTIEGAFEEKPMETTASPEQISTDSPTEPFITSTEAATTVMVEEIMTTTTEVTTEKQDISFCVENGMIIMNGKDVPSKDPCKFCQCTSGQVICAERQCPPAPKGCKARPLKEGNCCPDYACPTEDEILDDDYDTDTSNDNAIDEKVAVVPESEALAQNKTPNVPSLFPGAPTYPPELFEVGVDKSTEPSVVGTASSDILDSSEQGFSTTTSTTLTPEYFDEYDYDEGLTLDSIGPGACLFEGKVYVSAQQIPRNNPCDFCFCFRGDIICLQQSCPPPIPGCREETISGFCCPRYECPVKGGVQNITVPAPPKEPSGLAWLFGDQEPDEPGEITQQISGCEVQGHFYEVGAIVESSSGPCLQCRYFLCHKFLNTTFETHLKVPHLI